MSALDMSLDEIAAKGKKAKTPRGQNRAPRRGRDNRSYDNRGNSQGQNRQGGQQRGRGGRGGRFQTFNRGSKTGPYSRPGAADQGNWTHDQYEGDDEIEAIETPKQGNFGTKIEIKNIKYDILETELYDLVAKVAKPLSVKLKFDQSGRSTGTAAVIFRSSTEAQRTIREYNGRSLEGQTLEITEVGRVSVDGTGAFRQEREPIFRPKVGTATPRGRGSVNYGKQYDDDALKMQVTVRL